MFDSLVLEPNVADIGQGAKKLTQHTEMESQKQKGSDGRQTEPLPILCIAIFVGTRGLSEKITFIHVMWPCRILCHLSKKFVHDLSWWHLWMAQLSLVLSCRTTPIKVVAFLASSDSKLGATDGQIYIYAALVKCYKHTLWIRQQEIAGKVFNCNSIYSSVELCLF